MAWFGGGEGAAMQPLPSFSPRRGHISANAGRWRGSLTANAAAKKLLCKGFVNLSGIGARGSHGVYNVGTRENERR